MNALKPIAAACLLACAGGCSAVSQEFSWFHPQGGEYLFAFDKSACESQVHEQGAQLGNDRSGPFFACMYDRGYYLVNGDVIVQGPSSVSDDTPTAGLD